MPFNASIYFEKAMEALPEENFQEKTIFKKAALMYDFDLKKDFSEFGEDEINLLKQKAFLKTDGKYALPNDIRNTVITEKIGIENVANEISSMGVSSDFSQILLKSIESPQSNYQTLSTDEIFYSSKVADILPNQLNAQVLQTELQRRQFFVPFERITENFAGRKKELDRISEYVDWLPKKGVDNILKGIFFNAVGWHDKPPMLIQGIGGIGKSTLVAQFILEQNRNQNGKKLPFVYIDFDLPGFTIKEPLNILIESLQQLAIQYPEQKTLFEQVRDTIAELIYNKSNRQVENGNFNKHQSSNSSTRGFVYDSIEDVIHQYNYDLSAIKTPILIVFDSFEEMQYRATRDELNGFFTFIKEISDKIPRIRPIFVGRSEIYERVEDIEFERIELKDFDKDSAMALLKKHGIEDEKVCLKIFENLGGNPLVLLLVADLLIKKPESINDLGKIKDKKLEYLVNRILGHIHNPEIRQIAVPGMLIRSITTEIIKEVLAEPCKLGKIDNKKAKAIFDELQKEVALISRSSGSDEIAFRQDLRIACEKMIWEEYPKEANAIQANAIAYYKKRKDENEAHQAEYYYHLLKKSETPQELDKKTYEKIRKFLEASVKEFPAKSQLFISQLLSAKAAQTIVNKSAIIEFENYYLPQIKRGLNSELTYLKNLYKEINQRPERSDDPESEFSFYEAWLCQRLNKLNESNEIIDKKTQVLEAENLLGNPPKQEFLWLKVQNLEYAGRYRQALAILDNSAPFQESWGEAKLFKSEFLYNRLQIRIESEKRVNIKINIESYFMDDYFIDSQWKYLYKSVQVDSLFFKPAKEFDQIHDNLIKTINGFKELEAYCHKLLGVFLKDIALTGEFEIVFKDFLYILEAEGKLDLLMT